MSSLTVSVAVVDGGEYIPTTMALLLFAATLGALKQPLAQAFQKDGPFQKEFPFQKEGPFFHTPISVSEAAFEPP